jgi:hypothetical protein
MDAGIRLSSSSSEYTPTGSTLASQRQRIESQSQESMNGNQQ